MDVLGLILAWCNRGLNLQQPNKLHPYWDCDSVFVHSRGRQHSWDPGSSSQKTYTSCEFITLRLPASALNEGKPARRHSTHVARCLFTSFPLSLSPEVSGVQSSCHQGKGVKISVWFRFSERRTHMEPDPESWSGQASVYSTWRMRKSSRVCSPVWHLSQ